MIKKRRICRFCEEQALYVDYKDEKILQRFITEQGKIIPRRTSGTCANHQRMLNTAIKRARHLALLPFVADLSR
jgi:small subunit ribosomal protein S18